MSCSNKCPFCPVNNPCKKPHCPYTKESDQEKKVDKPDTKSK